MPVWILALSLALSVFALAALYLWLVRRRVTEMQLGLQALAGMHWRDFSELVKRALLERRGWVPAAREEGDPMHPRSDFQLADDTGRWLVSCKHGLAYRIGHAAINELGAAARLAGARGGVLITEGRVEREGLATAEKQAVEVLDGPRLWPLLKPYVPGDIESQVCGKARGEAVRRTGIAAAAACTLGLLLAVALESRQDSGAATVITTAALDTGAASRPAAAADAPAVTRPAQTVARPAPSAPSTSQVPASPVDPDAATLARLEQELAHALKDVPGVASAIWQTRQTLVINRTGEIDAIWPLLCAEVTRHPALQAVRIQINARPGVEEPVRWRQCATY